MSEPVKEKRAYDASRRREQALRNRQAMLDAGRALFLEHGFAATTIKMVAAQARVSTQSLYQVFGNKPGLVKALGLQQPITQLEASLAVSFTGDEGLRFIHRDA